LLRKMLTIDQKPSLLNKRFMKPVRSVSAKQRKSLNMKNRIDELEKINHDNQIMLRKLQKTKPHYSHTELEKEGKQHKYFST